MGAASDQIILNADSLTPVHRVMAQQPILIRVDYSDSQITGTIEAAGEAPVNISLDAPVFGGDGALEAAILGMELEDGFSAPVRIAEIAPLQRVRYFTVAVAGREDIDVPAGERSEERRVGREAWSRCW